jgi:vacuolar protein sorting-associated protein 35
MNKICELLSIPLESVNSLFDMPDFHKLLSLLDYPNMKKIGLKIINNLTNPNSKEKIDSLEKLTKLCSFISPLLKDFQNYEENKDYNFENEQNSVAKIIFIIKTPDIDLLLDIYSEFKNILFEGRKNRRIITFPSLVNTLIYFSQQILNLYENKKEENDKENIIYDISKLESDDAFYEFVLKIYKLISDTLKVLEEDFPQMAFKFYLLTVCQINNIQTLREKFEEVSLSFFNKGVNLYKAFDKEKKFEYFSDICQSLFKITIFSKENLENIINELLNEAKNMSKRLDQCNGFLTISQLYYIHFKDGKNVVDCLSKAKKVADFSLTNPHNLILYVLVLNKYIYYIDNDNEGIVEIKNEQIEDLVEAIKNHIITIKTDKNIDACFLPSIEKYFKNTIKLIESRKNSSEHKKIYDSINIDTS